LVQGLQATTGLMESTELNTHLQSRLVSVVGGGEERGIGTAIVTYTGTDTNQRSQSSLVESSRTLGLENLLGALRGAGVLGGGLQAHLDNVWGGLAGCD
jgi:hypothetical protein